MRTAFSSWGEAKFCRAHGSSHGTAMDAHDEPAGRSRQAMFAADHRKAISQSVVWEGMTCSGCCDVVAASRVRRDSGRGNLRVILPRGCQSFGPADYCHSNKCPLGNSAVDEARDCNLLTLPEQDWEGVCLSSKRRFLRRLVDGQCDQAKMERLCKNTRLIFCDWKRYGKTDWIRPSIDRRSAP